MKDSKKFRFYLKNGVGVYGGPIEGTRRHAHHATEIILSLQGCFKMEGSSLGPCKMVAIPHDAPHQFVKHECSMPVFIYLDPFHYLSQQLISFLSLNKQLINLDHFWNENIAKRYLQWTQGSDDDAESLVQVLIHRLTGTSSPPDLKQDERIIDSIEQIRSSLHQPIKLQRMAASVCLSESRYSHLFKSQVGIPFRRYVLWSRMQCTLDSIQQGNNLTAACYDGGFSDLAHFSKTFLDMFGVSPSSVFKG